MRWGVCGSLLVRSAALFFFCFFFFFGGGGGGGGVHSDPHALMCRLHRLVLFLLVLSVRNWHHESLSIRELRSSLKVRIFKRFSLHGFSRF